MNYYWLFGLDEAQEILYITYNLNWLIDLCDSIFAQIVRYKRFKDNYAQMAPKALTFTLTQFA